MFAQKQVIDSITRLVDQHDGLAPRRRTRAAALTCHLLEAMAAVHSTRNDVRGICRETSGAQTAASATGEMVSA